VDNTTGGGLQSQRGGGSKIEHLDRKSRKGSKNPTLNGGAPQCPGFLVASGPKKPNQPVTKKAKKKMVYNGAREKGGQKGKSTGRGHGSRVCRTRKGVTNTKNADCKGGQYRRFCHLSEGKRGAKSCALGTAGSRRRRHAR